MLWHQHKDLPPDGARWDSSPAPTVTLYNKSGGELRAVTTASLGPTTTLASSVVAGARAIGISDTTSLRRWEEYHIGPNAAGEHEWVRLDSVGNGYVKALDPVVYAYSSGNALQSHRMSTLVTTGTTGSVEWSCFAVWSYYVDAVLRNVSSEFHISHYAPRLNVTEIDWLQHNPGLRQLIGRDQKPGLILRDLWHQVVLPDVAKLLGSAGAMVAGEAVDRAVLYRADEYIYRQANNMERADVCAEQYTNQLEEIAAGINIIDVDESGGQSDDELPPSPRIQELLRG